MGKETKREIVQIMTLRDFWEWTKQHFTRKWTVWVHVAVGLFCAILFHSYPGLAALLFAAFSWFEWWQAKVEGDKGHLDFWDGVFGLGIGSGILWILNLTGVI